MCEVRAFSIFRLFIISHTPENNSKTSNLVYYGWKLLFSCRFFEKFEVLLNHPMMPCGSSTLQSSNSRQLSTSLIFRKNCFFTDFAPKRRHVTRFPPKIENLNNFLSPCQVSLESIQPLWRYLPLEVVIHNPPLT